jgi:hypothetical protein
MDAAKKIEWAVDTKPYGDLLASVLAAEAKCAAYREALKNVIRGKAKDRVKTANEALFGSVNQRGKEMLKVVKAAVQVWYFQDHGNDEDFVTALANLSVAMDRFPLKGATVKRWMRLKTLREGDDK